MPGRCAIALLALTFICITPAAGATEAAVSQLIRARVVDRHGVRTDTLHVHDLNMPEAIGQFYALRHFAPAWDDPAHVEALLRALADIRSDGLDPQDYQLPTLQQMQGRLRGNTVTATARADFDLLATRAYLRAVVHLFRGKVDPKTLNPGWTFALNDMPAATALARLNAAVDDDKPSHDTIAAAFARARPQQLFYTNLRSALTALRHIQAEGGWPQLQTQTTLKPGMHDAAVPVLRRRLAIAGYLPATPATGDLFDDDLAAAVRLFQRRQLLADDGVVGAATRAALNVPVSMRIDEVRVNLERARWLLHNLDDRAVIVDAAGFRADFLEHGQSVWHAAVQVGKPYRSTPIFRSKITYITFNPTWTVPPTIYRKDILPKVRRNLDYLAANHLRVLDTHGRELPAASIDWQHPGAIMLRADAGPENPLGRLAIRFPNPYSVYMHDTPHHELFNQRQRTFSSGCIRVEHPRQLVQLLLNDPEKWNRDAIDQAIDTVRTFNVPLAKPVPIVLIYWTVDVTGGAQVAFRPDVYRRDAAVLAALDKRS